MTIKGWAVELNVTYSGYFFEFESIEEAAKFAKTMIDTCRKGKYRTENPSVTIKPIIEEEAKEDEE